MYLYTGIIVLLLAALIILKVKRYKCGKWYVIFSMAIFGCLAAIRSSEVGNDTSNYLRIFNLISDGTYLDAWDERFETGYMLLNRLLAEITNNEQVLLIVTSIIIYACFIYFIIRHSKDYFFSIFLFVTTRFFGQTMSGIRFSIAVSILVIAYDRLSENHMVQFVLLVIAAALFHKTAIVFLFVVLFRYIKCNAHTIALWLIATVGCYFMAPYAVSVLFDIFPSYQSYSDRYITTGISVGVLLYIAVWGMSFAIGYAIQINHRNECKNMNLVNLMMMSTVTVYAMSMYFTLLDRVAQYFGIFIIIYLPNCIQMVKDTKKRYIIKGVVMAAFMIYFWGIQVLRPEWNAINIYKTFWMQ